MSAPPFAFGVYFLYGLDSRDSNTQATKNRTKILAKQAESSNSRLHGGAWFYLILARKKSLSQNSQRGFRAGTRQV